MGAGFKCVKNHKFMLVECRAACASDARAPPSPEHDCRSWAEAGDVLVPWIYAHELCAGNQISRRPAVDALLSLYILNSLVDEHTGISTARRPQPPLALGARRAARARPARRVAGGAAAAAGRAALFDGARLALDGHTALEERVADSRVLCCGANFRLT